MAISNITPQPDAAIGGAARPVSGQGAGRAAYAASRNTSTASAGPSGQPAAQTAQQTARPLTINQSGTPSARSPRGSIINIVV